MSIVNVMILIVLGIRGYPFRVSLLLFPCLSYNIPFKINDLWLNKIGRQVVLLSLFIDRASFYTR